VGGGGGWSSVGASGRAFPDNKGHDTGVSLSYQNNRYNRLTLHMPGH